MWIQRRTVSVLTVVFRFVSHIEGDLFKAWRLITCLFSLLPVFDRFFSRLDVFGNDDSSGNSSMLLHEEETLVSVGNLVIVLLDGGLYIYVFGGDREINYLGLGPRLRQTIFRATSKVDIENTFLTYSCFWIFIFFKNSQHIFFFYINMW